MHIISPENLCQTRKKVAAAVIKKSLSHDIIDLSMIGQDIGWEILCNRVSVFHKVTVLFIRLSYLIALMHNNFVNHYFSIPVVKKRKKFEPKVFNFTSQCFK